MFDIPPEIMAAGRRASRPGEIEELQRIAAQRRSQNQQRPIAVEPSHPGPVVETTPTTHNDPLAQFCVNPQARRAEFRRRLTEALDDALEMDAHARIHGLSAQRTSEIEDFVRTEFLGELKQYLVTNPDIDYVSG